MEKHTPQMEAIMMERFHKEGLYRLITVKDGIPFARYVAAYYEDGGFLILTYADTQKMAHIAANPVVALVGDWFHAQGVGEDLGSYTAPENQALVLRLREAFAEWIDNGDNDLTDPKTIILRVRLTRATVFHNSIQYEIDFTA